MIPDRELCRLKSVGVSLCSAAAAIGELSDTLEGCCPVCSLPIRPCSAWQLSAPFFLLRLS